MSLIEIVALAVGLSMDAFAVAVCVGLKMRKFTIRSALVVGLYFGLFQAGMPVIGYLVAMQLASHVMAFAPWISFAVLAFLGVRMMADSFKKEDASGEVFSPNNSDASVSHKEILPLAVATSIDALAVGAPLAFFNVNIAQAAMLIGATTIVISMCGVKIGNLFGSRFKSKAEFLGGVILIGIGVHILLEHLL